MTHLKKFIDKVLSDFDDLDYTLLPMHDNEYELKVICSCRVETVDIYASLMEEDEQHMFIKLSDEVWQPLTEASLWRVLFFQFVKRY